MTKALPFRFGIPGLFLMGMNSCASRPANICCSNSTDGSGGRLPMNNLNVASRLASLVIVTKCHVIEIIGVGNLSFSPVA